MNPSGPLVGYKVLEMATMVAGPCAGQILAGLGADVIKVEVPSGDPMRHSLPVHKGRGALFELFNRGKRSIAVDTRTDAGKSIVKRIAANVDAFIENSRPGVMERLGLGYDDLKAVNSDIIYLSINGVGDSGPLSHLPHYDQVLQGLTGFMYTQGGDGPPAHVRAGIVDKITGTLGAMAVLSGLLTRSPQGRGQKVNVNLLDAYASFMLPEVMTRFYFQDLEPEKRVNVSAGVFHRIVAKDGYATGMIFQRAQLESVAKAFDLPDLLTDERFTTTTLIVRNLDQLFAEISKVTQHMSKAEVQATAIQYELPLGPINDMEDFFIDRQVLHNNTFVDFSDEEAGPIRTLNSFAKFDKTPIDVRRMGPKLSEDADDILRSIGVNDTEIASLKASGTVKA